MADSAAVTTTPDPRTARTVARLLSACVGLGIAGSLFGLSVVASFGDPIPEPEAPMLWEAPAGQEELWARLQSAAGDFVKGAREELLEERPTLTALAAVNLFASVLLVAGAFLTRARAEIGLRLLGGALVLGQAYAAIKLFVRVAFEIEIFGRLRIALAGIAAEGGDGKTVVIQLLAMQALLIFAVGLAAIAELVFYVWATRVLRRPAAVELLRPDPDAFD